MIQQTIAQVIGPLFEPHFSEHSYGFRPYRSARMALAEMEQAQRDGLRFARYADDFLIFVRSRSAAERVLRTITRFIEGRLDLRINRTKSSAARLRDCTFLGFRMHQGKLRWTDAVMRRFKQRIRELTDRHNGRSMRQRICGINADFIAPQRDRMLGGAT